jgi:hypothetical protein
MFDRSRQNSRRQFDFGDFRFWQILLQKSVAGFFGQWFRRCEAIRDGGGA